MTTLDVTGADTMALAKDIVPDHLVRSDRYDLLAEIGRVSVHVAALEQVVLRAAERVVPDGQDRADDLRRKGAELSAALYRLERRISGDGRARMSTERLLEEATAVAADYAERERAVLASLVEALDDVSVAEVVKAYHRARLNVPTRPHPTLAAHPLLRRFSWRFAGPVDRLRDALDNRPVPESVAADAAVALATLSRLDAGTATGDRAAEVHGTTDQRVLVAA